MNRGFAGAARRRFPLREIRKSGRPPARIPKPREPPNTGTLESKFIKQLCVVNFVVALTVAVKFKSFSSV